MLALLTPTAVTPRDGTESKLFRAAPSAFIFPAPRSCSVTSCVRIPSYPSLVQLWAAPFSRRQKLNGSKASEAYPPGAVLVDGVLSAQPVAWWKLAEA